MRRRHWCVPPATAFGSHHYATFYAVAALGDDALERIADAIQNVRGGRHAALYGDDEELEPDDLAAAREHVSLFLAAGLHWLTQVRPSLTDRLRSP